MLKTTTYIGLQGEQIFSVNILTYFSILGVALYVIAVLFLCYFQKLQLLVAQKIWTDFCCIVLLYLWTQKVCLRFSKSYFKLEKLIFLSFAVSFLVDMFHWKAPFLTKKTAVKSETHFSRGSYRKLTWQSIKRKFHHWQKVGPYKIIHNARLHWKR